MAGSAQERRRAKDVGRPGLRPASRSRALWSDDWSEGERVGGSSAQLAGQRQQSPPQASRGQTHQRRRTGCGDTEEDRASPGEGGPVAIRAAGRRAVGLKGRALAASSRRSNQETRPARQTAQDSPGVTGSYGGSTVPRSIRGGQARSGQVWLRVCRRRVGAKGDLGPGCRQAVGVVPARERLPASPRVPPRRHLCRLLAVTRSLSGARAN
jgi:hypothetical protein